jgi:hypothetical protein
LRLERPLLYWAKEWGGETFGEPMADAGADLDILFGGGII